MGRTSTLCCDASVIFFVHSGLILHLARVLSSLCVAMSNWIIQVKVWEVLCIRSNWYKRLRDGVKSSLGCTALRLLCMLGSLFLFFYDIVWHSDRASGKVISVWMLLPQNLCAQVLQNFLCYIFTLLLPYRANYIFSVHNIRNLMFFDALGVIASKLR